MKGAYPIIFKTYCRKFNWGYWDYFNDVPFIQQSFLYTLYLLKIHGNKMLNTTVYQQDFIMAFPNLVEEFDDRFYSTQEEELGKCYFTRSCKRFLVFLGLADKEVMEDGNYKIRKTPLFDDLVKFNFSKENKCKKIHTVVSDGYLH